MLAIVALGLGGFSCSTSRKGGFEETILLNEMSALTARPGVMQAGRRGYGLRIRLSVVRGVDDGRQGSL